MASRYPDRFAATVPIAGVRTATDFDAVSQLSTPTWAFHARNDSVVSKDRSREVVNAMLSAASEPTLEFPANTDRETTFELVNDDLNLRCTSSPGDDFSWSRVYDTPKCTLDVRSSRSRTGLGNPPVCWLPHVWLPRGRLQVE